MHNTYITSHEHSTASTIVGSEKRLENEPQPIQVLANKHKSFNKVTSLKSFKEEQL